MNLRHLFHNRRVYSKIKAQISRSLQFATVTLQKLYCRRKTLYFVLCYGKENQLNVFPFSFIEIKC